MIIQIDRVFSVQALEFQSILPAFFILQSAHLGLYSSLGGMAV